MSEIGTDIEKIQKNEKLVAKVVPMIVKYIKAKYGNDVRVKTTDIKTYHADDEYTAKCKLIEVFVLNEKLLAAEIKHKLYNEITSVFGIDMTKYGSCLDLKVYKVKWEKV